LIYILLAEPKKHLLIAKFRSSNNLNSNVRKYILNYSPSKDGVKFYFENEDYFDTYNFFSM
jgi:hypothetical protein